MEIKTKNKKLELVINKGLTVITFYILFYKTINIFIFLPSVYYTHIQAVL